jgi:two-component system invasion response regulator UvrY
VVAEADSGEEAVRAFPKIKPDVIVMDISMPGIGGLEAVHRILAREVKARILVLSAHEDAMHARRVLKAGAVGYLGQAGHHRDPGRADPALRAGRRSNESHQRTILRVVKGD